MTAYFVIACYQINLFKQNYLDEKIKLSCLSYAILITLFVMNAYFSVSTIAHRVIKYYYPDIAGGYLIFR